MNINTPEQSTKRIRSEGSTPSPSIIRACKIAKMAEHSVNFSQIQAPAPSLESSLQGLLTPEEFLQRDDDQKWDFVINHINLLSTKISALQTENENLHASVSSANGKITYLENQLEKIKNRMSETEWKALQNDIVLYNLPESHRPDKETLVEFLVTELGISQQDIHSQENTKGKIIIDTMFRMGRKQNEKGRPMVVTFSLQSAKRTVIDHYRRLKVPTPIRITDHFPSEMRERRSVQKDTLKKYKDLYRNDDTKVKLVKDKLIVGTKVTTEAFAVNPLKSSPDSIPKHQTMMEHTEILEENGSFFQGHAIKIASLAEAASAKEALFQLPSVSQCDHIIYAYSLTDHTGMKVQGNSDGGEWAASKILANLLEQNLKTNIFLAVTRKHEGPNLGQKDSVS